MVGHGGFSCLIRGQKMVDGRTDYDGVVIPNNGFDSGVAGGV
jgi:hypothetical protein